MTRDEALASLEDRAEGLDEIMAYLLARGTQDDDGLLASDAGYGAAALRAWAVADCERCRGSGSVRTWGPSGGWEYGPCSVCGGTGLHATALALAGAT